MSDLTAEMEIDSSSDSSSEKHASEDSATENESSDKDSNSYDSDRDRWTGGFGSGNSKPPAEYFNTKVEYFSHTDDGKAVFDPLFDGAKISNRESDCLIAGFSKCHYLTEADVDALLNLIDGHLPAQAPSKPSTFQKLSSFNPKTRYYCHQKRVLTNDSSCQCGQTVDSHNTPGNFKLFQLSIAEQIKRIVQNPNLSAKLRKDCTENDVVTGEFYKELRKQGVIGDDDLTLQLNIGAVKHTDNEKVYAVQALINELPYDARIHNVILCGVFYGKKIPSFDLILRPFVKELKDLSERGLSCKGSGKVKVHTILCTCASAGSTKPNIQGISIADGCSFCLSTCENGVYGVNAGELRSVEQHLSALTQLQQQPAEVQKRVVQGVWKRSAMMKIPVFDIVRSFIPNYVDLISNLVTAFWKVWRTSQGKEYHLKQVDLFNIAVRLFALSPTCDTVKKWKNSATASFATKWNFLMYYSLPCLKDNLQDEYLDHWFLLVYAINMFSKPKMTDEEFEKAEKALKKFVKEIPNLYPGEKSLMTYGTHELLHLPKAVKDFGAVWGSSPQPYERFKVFFNEFGGSGNVQLVCQSFLALRGMHIDDWSVPGKKFFDSMCGETSSIFNSYSELKVLDRGEMVILNPKEKSLIESRLHHRVEREARKCRQVAIGGRYFEALKYQNIDDSLLKTEDEWFSLSRVLVVKNADSVRESVMLICEPLATNWGSELIVTDVATSDAIMSLTCREDDPDEAIMAEDVCQKCVSVPYHNSEWRGWEDLMCIIPLVDKTLFRVSKEELDKLKTEVRLTRQDFDRDSDYDDDDDDCVLS